MTETVDQAEMEDEVKKRAAERLLVRQMQRKGMVKVLGGTIAGLAILIPGLVFFSLWGILLILVGITVTMTAIFGGVGYGGLFLTRRASRLMSEGREKKTYRKENRVES